jgi:purine catabolism regulator
MTVTFRDLCAEESLGVVLRGAASDLARPIRWVTVTELEDPSPWLMGGELVLTTRLWQKPSATQRGLVRRLNDVEVAGFGFATGRLQQERPEAALAEARAIGLPAVEVPYASPFIAITRFVAERVFEQEHARQRRLINAHDQLAQVLLSGQGLHALVRAVARLTDAPTALIDVHGRALASEPAGHQWDLPRIVSLADDPGAPLNGPFVRLIEINREPVAMLCSETTTATDVLPYAERLIGLELAKQHAVAEERRDLARQIIHDILRSVISDDEASRRVASFDLSLQERRSVVLATGDCDAGRLRSIPWGLPLGREGKATVLAALIGNTIVALVPDSEDPLAVGRQLEQRVGRIASPASVGVGGAYPGADGLRWSHLEAQDALTRGPGVHQRARLDLARYLLADPAPPLRRLARDTLRPLHTADSEQGSNLVTTLRTYFATNESVTLTAERLFVHRNTVHHRIRLIERLTNLSLSSLHDKMQLWLALTTLDSSRRSTPSDEST